MIACYHPSRTQQAPVATWSPRRSSMNAQSEVKTMLRRMGALSIMIAVLGAGCAAPPALPPRAKDPGVRGGAAGAGAILPPFITLNGPVREVRFKSKADGTPDGGVHNLYTIAGRSDAPGCTLVQPDFKREAARDNLIFCIPPPVFGAGLIEAIPDQTITADLRAEPSSRAVIDRKSTRLNSSHDQISYAGF